MASAPALISTSQEVDIFAWEAESSSGWIFLAVLLGVYLLGFLSFPCLKVCLCWCCCRPKVSQAAIPPASTCTSPSSSSSFQFLPLAATNWQNLVVTGLRLVHRRQKIAVAFKALGDQSSLRQNQGSKPSAARQRALAKQRSATPLKEGPAITD